MMKNTIFFLALLISTTSNAQTVTQSSIPTVIDSDAIGLATPPTQLTSDNDFIVTVSGLTVGTNYLLFNQLRNSTETQFAGFARNQNSPFTATGPTMEFNITELGFFFFGGGILVDQETGTWTTQITTTAFAILDATQSSFTVADTPPEVVAPPPVPDTPPVVVAPPVPDTPPVVVAPPVPDTPPVVVAPPAPDTPPVVIAPPVPDTPPSIPDTPTLVDLPAIILANVAPRIEHCEQSLLNSIVDPVERFQFARECGDGLFGTSPNVMDGGGGNVGDGNRYTGVPRADLNGPGEWANHTPQRRSGPDGEACGICHIDPDAGSGAAALNIVSDINNTGILSEFITRNTTNVLGDGPIQLVAEEMTAELQATRNLARETACATQTTQEVYFAAKAISFGSAIIDCDPALDISSIDGVNEDLVIRPLGWKGAQFNLRNFNRGAGHNDIGMQAVELVGEGIDGDFDGVANEYFIGDMTAMAIYLAALPRPVTRVELARNGLLGELGLEPLAADEALVIDQGSSTFSDIGCASCHIETLTIDNTVYSEPSANPAHRDAVFPSGIDPITVGVDPSNPITFDVAADIPDNRFIVDGVEVNLGNIETNVEGQGLVRLYGDLKRHDMGPELAENVDDGTVPSSFWLTKELWGVGSTGPYLHDGRASTLTEAIVAHGGEAAASRDNFTFLDDAGQSAVLTFLNNLILVREE